MRRRNILMNHDIDRNPSLSPVNGTNPNLCARTSSWIIDVLLEMYTFSTARVGTSAIMIRRNVFAIEASM